MIQELSIVGYRGFGNEQTIKFSIPDGITLGSGLNILLGSNNSGKTTIIESIRAFIGQQTPSFSEGKRNILNRGFIKIKITDLKNNKLQECEIKTVESGGSETIKSNMSFIPNYYIVQSRRAIQFEFGKSIMSRENYINANHLYFNRRYMLDNFEYRLFNIQKYKKEKFDILLSKILGNEFDWTIEQRDGGNFYIKCIKNNISHSSEGIGDGIWSIFTICAALFDAENESVIVIDEPELSIHPSLQRRLLKILEEYGLIEIKEIGRNGRKIHKHSVAEKAFGLTKL